jgi:hypothetical protein
VAKRATSDLRKWAAVGAGHRLEQLTGEIEAIYRVFPELRTSGTRRRYKTSSVQSSAVVDAESAGEGVVRRKRRRKMSAEGRKRISDAQKARWAKQKANAPAPEGARKKR